MHADHENILRDKLHKYAICRRSRFQKMYPTFWMFCNHYGVSISFFVSGGPNTASRRTKTLATLGHRFNPIHQPLFFFWPSVSFCDRFPLDLSIFDLFLAFWTAGVCFRLQENLGILQRLENAWHLSVVSKFHTKILRRPHEKQAAYNACSPFREKIMSMPCRHVQVKLWCPPCPHRDSSFRSRAASRRGCLRVAFRRSRHGIGEEPTIEQTV